ncbi:MAG: hypothetical protein MR691_02250 [Clostridium sp.]|nr:hypothetical protein [Clostridium sp.]
MNTRVTNKIQVDESFFNEVVILNTKQRIKEAIKKFDVLKKEIENLIKKSNWVKIGNKDVYYESTENAIIPDITKIELALCNKKFISEFEDFKGELITKEQVLNLFFDKVNTNPFMNNNTYEYKFLHNGEIRIRNILRYRASDNSYSERIRLNDSNLGCRYNDLNWTRSCTRCNLYCNCLKIPVVNLNKSLSKLELFLQNNIYPEAFSKDLVDEFNLLLSLYSKGYIKFEGENIVETDKFIKDVLNQEFLELNKVSFKKEEILDFIKSNKVNLDDDLYKLFSDSLLNCEKERADIEPYDIKILEDPNRGHWDLWSEEALEGKVIIDTDKKFVARNPLADVNDSGIIGIDFGTKSTVVVYQKDKNTVLPMRIGMGQYTKKISTYQYENPTVMEFINFADFIEKYNKRSGRPNTKWSDLTVSHTAFSDMNSPSSSDDYYAFFSDLKQWTGDKKRQIRIKDKHGNEKVLKPYLELDENEIDPIEIYAYYIGLYINNMFDSNGIYLNYILSFPVTYEKAIRDKITKSFEKGLKKSLPVEVLNDETCMSKFRVTQGASEPAAYAICALQEYKISPENGEKVFYGVFDFGGGTTDFDFGTWRKANEKEKRRYNYVIEHFGAGGDQYLGGENLLELLSFEVFKKNQDKLREQGIPFSMPAEGERFPGSEILISDSQESRFNTRQLMEVIRPLWEKREGYEKNFESGVIKVSLFDKSGKRKEMFELEINSEELEKLLKNRIEKGVKNFFEALKLTFNFKETEGLKNIIILLAGNSSKSPIVKELFNKYIEIEAKQIREYNNKENVDCNKSEEFIKEEVITDTKEEAIWNIAENEYFKIYPPLGSMESYKMQGIEEKDIDITKPTGKTGVAFGLIECRKGGRIKVVSKNNDANDEIKFKYYIGHDEFGKFCVDISREVKYNEWQLFIDASEDEFEFYYTNLPEATTNNLSINGLKRKNIILPIEDEEASVYMRAVSPSCIEYVVGKEEDIKNEKYMTDIEKIELS